MTWETSLLWGAMAAFGAALAHDLWPGRSPRRETRTRRLFLAGVVMLTTALALLLLYFLLGALDVEYVWSYTRRDYPWYYRLAGLWAGQKGTLLLWAALTALAGALFLRRGRQALATGRLGPEAETTLRRVRGVLLGVLLALTGATLVADTFDATHGFFLRDKPDGNGLQPVLLTPFMVIHPPVQFAAYALTGLLFAGAVAHVAFGDRAWAPLVRPWARLAWLLSTVGLGLGALWAYYVLNFLGFWAWDPVETANLIAWFPVTLLLHALLPTRTGAPRATAPLYAFLSFALALFSTIATRSGLWVSQHAFTDPSKNFASDPLERFLNILAAGPLVRYLSALLAATLLVGLAAALHGRLRSRSARALVAAAAASLAIFTFLDTVAAYSLLFQAAHAVTLGRSAPFGLVLLAFAAVALVVLTGPEETARPTSTADPWTKWAHPRRLLDAGLILLGLALLVVFLIDVAGVNGYDRGVFDARAPFLALPIFLTLAATFLRTEHGPRTALLAPLLAGLLGIALALAWPDHARALVAAPALLLVLFASLQRLWGLNGAPTATRRDRWVAALLLAGALLGFLHWGNPPTRMAFGSLVVRPPWAWAVPAYAASLVALAASALHRTAPSRARARLGGLALLPVVGPWALATMCGIGAILLAQDRPGPSTGWPALFRQRRPLLRTSTIYLLHAALAIGLLGYATSTYESHESEPLRFGAHSGDTFAGYTLRLLDSRGVGLDPDQGLPREIHARVLVLRDGEPLEEATLVYWLVVDGTNGHYDARVTVVRRATLDLYLYPREFTTRQAVLVDHVHDVRPTEAAVEGVVVTAKVLPGMTLVWSGLWLLGLAMSANLALGGFQVAAPTPARAMPSTVPQTSSAARPAPDPTTPAPAGFETAP